jgi:hypothetical protein
MIAYLANKTEFRDDVPNGGEQLFAYKYRTLLPTTGSDAHFGSKTKAMIAQIDDILKMLRSLGKLE